MNWHQLLPSGLTACGARMSDVPAVTTLIRASEAVDHGFAEQVQDEVGSYWRRPGFDPAADVVLVLEGDALVGYAEIYGWRADGTVHPEARSRGIGTALIAWTEERRLAQTPTEEGARLGQTIIDTNLGARDLLMGRGYAPRHTSWVLTLPADAALSEQPLPSGIRIRTARLDFEERDVYQIIEDAFNEWPTRVPASFELWKSIATGRSDFDPGLCFVADHGGEVVGAVWAIMYPTEGWIEQLAVRADRRNLGIGRALLRTAFGELRRRDAPSLGLNTDSRTGALDLYLGIGMTLRDTYTHYSRLLRPPA